MFPRERRTILSKYDRKRDGHGLLSWLRYHGSSIRPTRMEQIRLLRFYAVRADSSST